VNTADHTVLDSLIKKSCGTKEKSHVQHELLRNTTAAFLPVSFQWCPVSAPEAMGTIWNTEGFLWTSWNSVTVRVTEHLHKFCRRLWSLHSCMYWKAVWTQSRATGFRWPCLSRGAGPHNLQRCLPTSTILWFSERRR